MMNRTFRYLPGNPGEEQIAIAGRVPCRADAMPVPFRAGDLLTTSWMPGHAIKAVPAVIDGREFYPDGTILGRQWGRWRAEPA